MGTKRKPPFGALCAVRAIGDASSWLVRHYRWEVPLVLAAAVVAAVLADAPPASAATVLWAALLTGGATLALLWLAAFVVYLVRAPGLIRTIWSAPLQRRGAMPMIQVRIGRPTLVAGKAMSLTPPLMDLIDARRKYLGTAHEPAVRQAHGEVLRAIESFGEFAVRCGGEAGSRRERRDAVQLYRSIRGMTMEQDPQIALDAVRSFTAPAPMRRLPRPLRQLRNWWMRLWLEVS